MPDVDTVERPLIADCPVEDGDAFQEYYQRFFPFRLLFQWLNHSPVPGNDFANREFAYSFPGGAYSRYLAFPTAEEFKKDVVRQHPERFEIGAIYKINPRDRKTVRRDLVKPVAKEFVIDIDLTDYTQRTCCEEAKICTDCWQFITVAIKVLERALREDFGFKHILWVYSGRRGAHAWVCDRRARQLDDYQRLSVISYLDVLGKLVRGKLVHLKRPLHPYAQQSFDIIKTDFVNMILKTQDCWRDPASAEQLAKSLSNDKLEQALKQEWKQTNKDSAAKWKDIDVFAAKLGSGALDTAKLRDAKQDLVFEYMFPRLDVNVSTQMGHLLKSPFCVHPKTGRVCVPIDMDQFERFNHLEVPTVASLFEELNAYQMDNESTDARIETYEKTSLKPYVEVFQRFVSALLKDEQEANKRQREDTLDF